MAPEGVRRQGGGDLVGGERPAGINLQSVVDRGDLGLQPALDRSVALAQRAETGANHLAGRGVAADGDELVKEAGLVGGQADGPLLDSRHRWRLPVGWCEAIIPRGRSRGEHCGG